MLRGPETSVAARTPGRVRAVAVAVAGIVAGLAALPVAARLVEPAAASPDRASASAGKRQPANAAPRPLTFGIYPGGAAGTAGPSGQTKPANPALRLARLERLRGGDRPFVLHLYDHFTRRTDAEQVPAPLAAEIAQYTARGFAVEVVLAYRPAESGGDVAGFVDFVRQRVRQLGPNDAVTGIQVTNEANVTGAPNAADGFYRGARRALVRGIVAADAEARRHGFGHIGVGFNWAYQLGSREHAFWSGLRRSGGPAFAAAVDWVGVDVYPGTWGPALPGRDLATEVRATTVRALSVLREQFLPLAGLAGVALRVSEAGYPTGPGRTEAMQRTVLRAVVRAVSQDRGRFGVTDFRWFDLRDADSDSPRFESHYGLLRDDYRPKPAFRTYRGLIASYG